MSLGSRPWLAVAFTFVACTFSTPVVGAVPHHAHAADARHATSLRHVSGIFPVMGSHREFGVDRPMVRTTENVPAPVRTTTNHWKLLATLPGAVIHDISFPTQKIGFIAAELGQVWKTSDGGKTWSEIMNLGFPYYWYGVHALNKNDVVISGFNDKTTQGIIRWSHDGGATWTQDIVLTSTGWSFRVRFVKKVYGLVVDGLSTTSANSAHYTTDGGQTASDWTSVVPDPNGGWFGNEFSFLPTLHAAVSGITYCASVDGGATWSCRPSIDNVFDGETFFANDRDGWVGGGEISPSVAGWVHRTTDGGKTWSGRTLQSPWPVREILFLTPTIGWAAGGNYSSNIGGTFFSTDGGATWAQDLNSGHEMDACDSRRLAKGYRVWCAGYNSSFSGAVYSLRYTSG